MTSMFMICLNNLIIEINYNHNHIKRVRISTLKLDSSVITLKPTVAFESIRPLDPHHQNWPALPVTDVIDDV